MFNSLSRLLRRSQLRLRLAFLLLSLLSGLLLLLRSRLLLLLRSRLLLLLFSLLLLLLRSGLLLLSRLLLLFLSLLLLLFRPRLPLRFRSRLGSRFLSGLRLFFLSRLSRLLRSKLGLLRLPPLAPAPRFVSVASPHGRLVLLLGLGDSLPLLNRFLSCPLGLGLLDLWDLALSTLLLRLRPFSEGEELRDELGEPLGLFASFDALASGLTLASCVCWLAASFGGEAGVDSSFFPSVP